jgi:hypothetical protein
MYIVESGLEGRWVRSDAPRDLSGNLTATALFRGLALEVKALNRLVYIEGAVSRVPCVWSEPKIKTMSEFRNSKERDVLTAMTSFAGLVVQRRAILTSLDSPFHLPNRTVTAV